MGKLADAQSPFFLFWGESTTRTNTHEHVGAVHIVRQGQTCSCAYGYRVVTPGRTPCPFFFFFNLYYKSASIQTVLILYYVILVL